MQSANTTYRLKEFIARRDGWQYKVYAIIFSVVFVILIICVSSQSLPIQKPVIFPIAFFGFTSGFLWYKILDKRIKLTINAEGIRYKSRKVITWDNIQRFYFEGRHHKVSSYYLFVETKHYGELIKIDVSDLDQTYHHIADAIMQYSSGNGLEYGGISDYAP